MAENATAAEVRTAYRTAARRLHPDLTGGEAASGMQALNAAWHVLSDPGRRAAYDRSLREAPAAAATAAEAPHPGDPPDSADDIIDLIRDLQDDTPVGPVRSAEGWWAMLPNIALVIAVGLLFGAILFASPALLVFSGGAFFGAVALYILVPLRAMTRPR